MARQRSDRRSRAEMGDRYVKSLPSLNAYLQLQANYYRARLDQRRAIAGPVTHLSPEEYYATKIVEVVQRSTP